eukprot:gene13193-15587_t
MMYDNDPKSSSESGSALVQLQRSASGDHQASEEQEEAPVELFQTANFLGNSVAPVSGGVPVDAATIARAQQGAAAVLQKINQAAQNITDLDSKKKAIAEAAEYVQSKIRAANLRQNQPYSGSYNAVPAP